MNTRLLEYYQGSVATPEGFKGFMPGSTAAEIEWVCQQLPANQRQQYTECRPPQALPATGSHNLNHILIGFVVWIAVWMLVRRVRENQTC